MDAVQAPIVPVIGGIIRQVPGTISLGQGVVHYGPPHAALDAVRDALTDASTHEYQDGAGLPALVERLAEKLRAENGIDVARGTQLMVTAGANMAFVHAVLAITAPGDEIILNVPFYFNHEMAIQMADCTAVRVATDDRYQPRLDALRAAITDRTRAIVTVTPNNPSGAVFSEDALRAINALCRDRGIYHIADEVYEYFTYGAARHVSSGSFPGAEGHTIAMYSLSKAYGFAGWRVGYMTYPEHLADGDGEEPGHDRGLRAGGVAGGGHRRAGRRTRVLRAPRPRAGGDSRHRRLEAGGAGAAGRPCRRPTARSTC